MNAFNEKKYRLILLKLSITELKMLYVNLIYKGVSKDDSKRISLIREEINYRRYLEMR